MKHYNKLVYNYGDTILYDYTELTEDHWFDCGQERVDGEGSWKYEERPHLMFVEARYWSREYGRRCYNGNKFWEYAGRYTIEKEDLKELQRLLKIWFPNCEFRYKYYK